jgi:hypothetical protein
MMDTVLLFDMDGVLLQPRGYHCALQETVLLIGKALGFENIHLYKKEIYAFEAAGITSEWDSSAICLGLMMREVWKHDPTKSVPRKLNPAHPTSNPLQLKDWRDFLYKLETIPAEAGTPRQRATILLKEHLSKTQQEWIADLMGGAYEVQDSLTHRVFQELVLGSHTFQKTYGLSPWFNCKGYLKSYDRPLLSSKQVKALKRWLGKKKRAAIFTNRPSRPPDDMFGTPEAEIGAKVVGLNHLPIVGLGDMIWLSTKRKQTVHDFLKPSPVHILTSLLQAKEISKKKALNSAANLVHKNLIDKVWQEFHGAKIYVFEDTMTGMKSALRAKELLCENDIQIKLTLVGIATAKEKQESLFGLGAQVYPDLGQALGLLFELP